MNQNLLSEEQRTQQWYIDRSGKFTGSRFVDLLKRKKDADAVQPKAYTDLIWQCVVERLTGTHVDNSMDSASLRWGREYEPEAREFYSFETGEQVSQAGFVLHPKYSKFVGVSPDGLVGVDGGAEIKCPKKSEIHLARFLTGITDEFMPQVQGCMWNFDREWWDWISYDPRMPIHLRMFRQRVYRDDVYIKNLEQTVMLAEHEVRETLAKFSMENVDKLLKQYNQERIAA